MAITTARALFTKAFQQASINKVTGTTLPWFQLHVAGLTTGASKYARYPSRCMAMRVFPTKVMTLHGDTNLRGMNQQASETSAAQCRKLSSLFQARKGIDFMNRLSLQEAFRSQSTNIMNGSQTLNQAELYQAVSISRSELIAKTLKILKLLSLPEGSKVLDLGCGTGEITYKLAKLVGSKGQVIGVDPDKERLEIARRNNTFPNLTLVEGDSATFPEDQYDLIFCHYVTNWVEDKETMFKRVYKNLKGGGQFAIVAIIQQSSFALKLFELMRPEEQKQIDEMFHFCSVEKYDQLAAVNGFTVTLKEEDTDVHRQPDFESCICAWKGISCGVFDPEKVDKEGLEKLRQKYKGEWNLQVVKYILTKN